MLYYAFTLYCPHCNCAFEAKLVAKVEPPPDALFHPRCPKHGGPMTAAFRDFKPCEPFGDEAWHLHYPPRPGPPPVRWWQFWKW